MTAAAVRVIGTRTTNAQAIADCRTLGYLDDDHSVLDLTYGLGRFWKHYRPARLVANDIDPRRDADLRIDWTTPEALALLQELGDWDDIAFDPPYKLNGTSAHPSDDGYGVTGRVTELDRMTAIARGTHCALRLARRHVLVKVQDQVVSGRKVWQTHLVVAFADELGARLIDQLHVQSYRPQPAGRRQLHARQDYSTLLIFDASTVPAR